MGQFVLEAVLIAAIGGGVGIVIAQTACSIFASIDLNNEVLKWLGKPTISLVIGIVTVSILTLIGLVSGFFPARRAASISPVEALRYE
jgi:putative ABC transport system permease protein